MREFIKIDDIIMDSTCQTRRMNGPVVYDYADLMKAGTEFPAIVVFRDSSGQCWLADGFHRVAAAKEARIEGLLADVKDGGQRDAMLYALGPANNSHGLALTREERRQRVIKMLQDPEWEQWSDRQIAKHCGVTHPTVAVLREQTGKFTSERKTADGRVMNTAGINAGRHWGQSNDHAFWQQVKKFDLNKDTILSYLQPGATKVEDLKMSKEDAWRRLDQLASEKNAALFPVGSYVYHINGYWGQVKQAHSVLLRVFRFDNNCEDSWHWKDCELSSEEDWKAATEQKQQPPTPESVEVDDGDSEHASEPVQADGLELPIRQVQFLQALAAGSPVKKNAATRMALRRYDFISQTDVWEEITLTSAGRLYLESRNLMPDVTFDKVNRLELTLLESLYGVGWRHRINVGYTAVLEVLEKRGLVCWHDAGGGYVHISPDGCKAIGKSPLEVAPFSSDVPNTPGTEQPVATDETPEPDRIEWEAYESEDIVELLPSLRRVLEYGEGNLDPSEELFEDIRRLIVWADDMEQVLTTELEAANAQSA